MEIVSSIKEKAELLIQRGYETDAGGYIRRGWETRPPEVAARH